MAHTIWYVEIIYMLAVVSDATAFVSHATCEDIDTAACDRMKQQRPDVCSVDVIASRACRRFCNLCPIKCYACDMNVLGYNGCNTTVTCNQGEVCMRKELESFVDGHREYQMSCEQRKMCDGGADVSFAFGKRIVHSRDLTIHCCSDDLCNNPEIPTTTTTPTTVVTTGRSGCQRDIFLVVDESTSMVSLRHVVLNFIVDIVSNLDIGTDKSLVSMATFASTTLTHWDLATYTNKVDLKHAIETKVNFRGGYGDLNAALTYLINLPTLPQHENRRNIPNVIIIITDDGTKNYSWEQYLRNEIHSHNNNIITIGINGDVSQSELEYVATDNGHVFKLSNYQDFHLNMPKLLNLICQ